MWFLDINISRSIRCVSKKADHSRQSQNKMLLCKTVHRKQEQKQIISVGVSLKHRCWTSTNVHFWHQNKSWSRCVVVEDKIKGPLECEQVLEPMNKAEPSWLSSFKRGSEWDWASVSNLEQLSGANVFWGCQSNNRKWWGGMTHRANWLAEASLSAQMMSTHLCKTGTSRLAYAVDVLGQ